MQIELGNTASSAKWPTSPPKKTPSPPKKTPLRYSQYFMNWFSNQPITKAIAEPVKKRTVTQGTPSQVYSAPLYPSYSAGGGYTLPEYSLPQINITVPNLTWSPTEEQLAGYRRTGATRAATVIDPQVAAQQEALARFRTQVENERAEVNPRYTAMSLALANIIKNQMYQPGVEELIRRGAVESGNLAQLAERTGRYETEKRGAVEQERNTILNALANQMLAKQQEVSDAMAELEKLRGLYTDVYSSEAEQQAYQNWFTGKQTTFENELAKAQLQNAIAAAIAEQKYKSALLSAQQQQSAFENQLAQQKFGLEQALAQYQMRPKITYQKPEQTITVNTIYGPVELTKDEAIRAGYISGQPSLLDFVTGKINFVMGK